jgi:hypothetical protein
MPRKAVPKIKKTVAPEDAQIVPPVVPVVPDVIPEAKVEEPRLKRSYCDGAYTHVDFLKLVDSIKTRLQHFYDNMNTLGYIEVQRIRGELSILKAQLGQMLPDTWAYSQYAEMDVEAEIARLIPVLSETPNSKNKPVGVTAAKVQAEVGAHTLRRVEIGEQLIYQRTKILHADV